VVNTCIRARAVTCDAPVDGSGGDTPRLGASCVIVAASGGGGAARRHTGTADTAAAKSARVAKECMLAMCEGRIVEIGWRGVKGG
jgi:hypothetical protein